MISMPKLKTMFSQLDPHTVRPIVIKTVWAILALGLLALAGKLVGAHIPQADQRKRTAFLAALPRHVRHVASCHRADGDHCTLCTQGNRCSFMI